MNQCTIEKQKLFLSVIFVVLLLSTTIQCYGKTVYLTEEQVQKEWGGLGDARTETEIKTHLTRLISQETYESWFPRRYGSEAWCTYRGFSKSPGEYYSYENFVEAVISMDDLKYKKIYREGAPSCAAYYRLHKPTNKETLIYEDPSFNNKWNQDKKLIVEVVDMGSFLNSTDDMQNQRELSAFFANVSHETEGMYYKEEIRYTNHKTTAYSTPHAGYPAVKGVSYHGRGPLQLSWNYNYGLVSGLIYGDPSVLLTHPEKVSETGKIGYMAAISFWMLPQGLKPSCHQAMQEDWMPTTRQQALGIKESGFGVTINIIHGNAESNQTIQSDKRVRSRVAYYEQFAASLGLDVSGEKKDTYGMKQFR